ncbi:hypothetical protein [Agrococcus sp. TF02-05]|uniref:hypothetical protein n=1 Tax=Agrococcus sp. TF02-05 TaxID=2815211 RepID=UPI001AA16731|nr:hypothetical protein [Agrococcus sp. TF02-05]MBO1770466.1 hypothetical protein [Agrococcus sp. TF02-05]
MTITATTRTILEQYRVEAITEQTQLDAARGRLESELNSVLERLGSVSARLVDLERDLGLAPTEPTDDELLADDEPGDAEVADPWA